MNMRITLFVFCALCGCSHKNTQDVSQQELNHFSQSSQGKDSGYTVQELEQIFPRSEKNPRIMSLWPSTYIAKLAIEPAIPATFVLKNIAGADIPTGHFLWGPKEVLDAYDIENPQSLNGSLFHLYTSSETGQTGPKTFSNEEKIEKSLKDMGVKELSKKHSMWGKYPVLTFEGQKSGGHDLFTAWIGCNYCSNVLGVKLVYPTKDGHPNDEDRALWQTFLSKSRELPEPEYFLALGYDMKPGYTYFSPHGENILCVAEERTTDGLLQLVVIPMDRMTTYSLVKTEMGFAGSTWQRGKKAVKFFLTISKRLPEGGSLNYEGVPIPVFLKTVDQFSLDRKVVKKMKGVWVDQGRMSPIF